MFQTALVEVLKELGNIEFKPALLSHCPHLDQQPHYAVIDGNFLLCRMGQHEPDQIEELWLGTPDTNAEVLENFRRCYSKLLDKINPDHYSRIAEELYLRRQITVEKRDEILNDDWDTHQKGVKLLRAVETSGESVNQFCKILEKFGEYQTLIQDIRGDTV